MTTLHAFPQSARLSPQPLIPSPSIEKMRSAKVDMAPPRSISPTKSSVMKHLSNSTSVPSLRQVAVQQQQQISSQTLPNQKLKGMAGARQRAKDVWQRRKGSGSDLETTMSTVLELDGVDSPTVPNRPLATARQDTASGWRRHAFGSAMISSITPPPRMEELSILSPMETKNGRTSPNATNCQQANSTQDLPPAVPPKTPTGQNNKDISFFFERSPSIMDRSPVCEPVRAQTPQQPARPESPTLREELDAFRSYRTVSPIVSRPIPIRPGRPASPPKDNVQVFRKPLLVDTTRPRPSSPVKKETRSVTPLSDKRFEEPRKCPERPTPQTRPRAESVPLEASRLHKERRDKKEKEKKEQRPQLQLNTKTTQQSPVQPQKPLQPAPIEPLRPTPRTPEKPNLHKRQKSSTSDLWALPSGVRPVHAHGRYKAGEIQSLQHDARKQAQKYEVLRAVDVEQLSKELIQLEGRCQYLRNHCKNVRSERKTLHTRILAYLRSQRNFSQDTLLKQEEALAALDEAIEQWEQKIETTEDRRNQIRLKLLEHMTATLTIGSAIDGSLTPPATPEKEPVRNPENEMITVYALLADVEQELGRIKR